MTPEGRRRKARAIRASVEIAEISLKRALDDLDALCQEMGNIHSPTQRSTGEALRMTRVSIGQLDLFVSWLTTVAQKVKG